MFVSSAFNCFVINRNLLIELMKRASIMRISLIFRNFFRT